MNASYTWYFSINDEKRHGPYRDGARKTIWRAQVACKQGTDVIRIYRGWDEAQEPNLYLETTKKANPLNQVVDWL